MNPLARPRVRAGSHEHEEQDEGLAERPQTATRTVTVAKKALHRPPPVAQRHARRFNTFCVEYLNPFLNFHRPSLFATEVADAKKPGRIKRVYRPRDAMTPLDKLVSLPDAAKYLRKGVTLQELQQLARALSDVQAAHELSEARAALFRRVPARTG